MGPSDQPGLPHGAMVRITPERFGQRVIHGDMVFDFHCISHPTPPRPELRSSRKDEVKISYRSFFPGFFCSALEGLDYAGRGSGT